MRYARDDVALHHMRPRIRNLVLSGGGIKGLLYIFPLAKLEATGDLVSIREFQATSIGNVFSLCLAAGFSVRNIRRMMRGLRPEHFIHTDVTGFLANSTALSVGGDRFIDRFVRRILLRRFGDENLTLRQLYERTGCTLHCVATDLVTARPISISWRIFPDISVATAIVASCAVPGYVEPVAQRGHLFVDGAVADNQPIRFVPSSELPYTVGLVLWTEHPGGDAWALDETDALSSAMGQFSRIFKCMSQSNRRNGQHALSLSQRRVTQKIRAPVDVSALDFGISDETREILMGPEIGLTQHVCSLDTILDCPL